MLPRKNQEADRQTHATYWLRPVAIGLIFFILIGLTNADIPATAYDSSKETAAETEPGLDEKPLPPSERKYPEFKPPLPMWGPLTHPQRFERLCNKPDKRQQIDPIKEQCFEQHVGQVQMNFTDEYYGIGTLCTLDGKYFILSAAHNFWLPSNDPDADLEDLIPHKLAWFSLMRNGQQIPFSSTTITEVHVPPEYFNPINRLGGFDIAVALLAPEETKEIQRLADASLTAVTREMLPKGSHLVAAGYPGDKPLGTLWQCEGTLAAFKTSKMAPDHAVLRYSDIDTFGCQSGSALYSEIDGQLSIVGVHTHGHWDYNQGTAITPAVMDWIRRVISDSPIDRDEL